MKHLRKNPLTTSSSKMGIRKQFFQVGHGEAFKIWYQKWIDKYLKANHFKTSLFPFLCVKIALSSYSTDNSNE